MMQALAGFKPLVVLDFDRTIADTFSPPDSGGVTVEDASRYAINSLFGDEGEKVYLKQGGLNNREPAELVRDIARAMEIEFPEDGTARYISEKLSLILPQISREWPRLYPGVREFLQDFAVEESPVTYGVLGSGHDNFIKKVFEVNGIPVPEVFVTRDILSRRHEPANRERHKPEPYLLAEAHRQWEKSSGHPFVGQYLGRQHGKPYILCVGDDPAKDAGLALNARVPFIFLPNVYPNFVPDETRGQLRVNDFFELSALLEAHAKELQEGESFARILFNREDIELFPQLPEEQRPYARMLEGIRIRQEGLRRSL